MVEEDNKFLKHLRNCEACKAENLCSLGQKIFDEVAIEGETGKEKWCKNEAVWSFSNFYATTFLCKKHAENDNISNQLRGMKKEKVKGKKRRCAVWDKEENNGNILPPNRKMA